MTKWKITAGEDGVLADDWSEKDIITIGWDTGNIEDMNDEEIKDQSDDSQMTRFVGAREDGIEVGDSVIAYDSGRKVVIGVGEVTSECYYNPDNELELNHPYWRDVEWKDLGTPVRLHDLPEDLQMGGENQVFYAATLAEFGGDFERVVQAIDETQSTDWERDKFSLGSEAQVRDYIYRNIEDLGDYENAEREAQTGVGRVDVLGKKSDGDGAVAIEVKLGEAGDSAVGQLIGYVNSLQEKGKYESVDGILVAEDFQDRAETALKSEDNIRLVEFWLGLQFDEVNV